MPLRNQKFIEFARPAVAAFGRRAVAVREAPWVSRSRIGFSGTIAPGDLDLTVDRSEDPMSDNPVSQKVVITPAERLDGSAMQQSGGAVRDLKLIYPETGFDAMTLCLGIVEIEPGHHTPLHRHRCEEVYYVVNGSGQLESDGQRHALGPGCAVLNRAGTRHRVFNTGSSVLRLVVVAGIMLVPLLPQWPTASPYEVFEGSTAEDHPPSNDAAGG
jgi:mannose-6-phosphate isomerase-like protein (cupin superfamily)